MNHGANDNESFRKRCS